jgi:hypothetical protein
MSTRGDLLKAVTALEETFRRSAGLGGSKFRSNRREVVQLRREIGARMSELAVVSAALDDAGLRERCRDEVSRMRAAVALHHASWPVVAIDLENTSYQVSIQTMRAAYRRFIEWAKT